MSAPQRLFRNIVVAANPKLPDAAIESQHIAGFLGEHGLQASHGLLYSENLLARLQAREFDLLIAVGGDGTMLRAGHLCAPLGLPILGVNLGHFGFLMELRQQQWRQYLPRLLQGDYWLEQRMMLTAEHWHVKTRLGSWLVLNEAVVGRSDQVRPVHVTAYVDGRMLTTYVADALIAATPTGSTAYALAAGGPILPPELRNILLVPVAPHLSIDRAIILAEGSSVTLTVQSERPAVLCIDGQPPIPLDVEDHIEVCAAEHTASFVRFQDPGYFYRNLTPHMNQNPSTGNSR